jgi:uncharacterized membrane protein YgcG
VERALQRLVSKVLKVQQDQVGMNFSFGQLGGDEISALEMVAACRTESLMLKPSDVLASDSLAQLAFQTLSRGGVGQRWQGNDGGAEPAEFGLSPMQRLYFETPVGGDDGARGMSTRDAKYRFNSSLLLRVKRADVPAEDVRQAVEAVVTEHAILRARFRPSKTATTAATAGGWIQSIAPMGPGAYGFRQQAIGSDDDMAAAIGRAQASINVMDGPIFAAEHLLTDDGQQLLYVVAHHLVTDMVSWRIVVHDLDEHLEHKRLLSQPSMPFYRWNELQRRAVEAGDVDTTLPFELPGGGINTGYWALDSRPNTYGDAVEAGFTISPELTAVLQTTCNQVFRTESADIYLAAVLLSFAQTFTDRAVPVVWNQEHGRETRQWGGGGGGRGGGGGGGGGAGVGSGGAAGEDDAEIEGGDAADDSDIAETVGWFASMCPVRVDTAAGDDFANVVRRIKDVRRSIPRRGVPYFASRMFGGGGMGGKGGGLGLGIGGGGGDWPFEVMFSYAGSLQQLERENGVLEQLVPGQPLGSATSDIGPSVGRIALFEVSAVVDEGAAQVKLLYNRGSRHQDRIRQWVQTCERVLLDGIERLRYRPQELTLADVPLLRTTYRGLARLNADRLPGLGLSSARDVESVYPATALQQEALIGQSRDASTFNNHFTYELALPNGEVPDGARICNAWEHVVAASAALRTVFVDSVSADGVFDQVVLRRCSPKMLFIEVGKDNDPVAALNALPPLQASGPEPRHRLTVCKARRSTYLKVEVSQALCDVSV